MHFGLGSKLRNPYRKVLAVLTTPALQLALPAFVQLEALPQCNMQVYFSDPKSIDRLHFGGKISPLSVGVYSLVVVVDVYGRVVDGCAPGADHPSLHGKSGHVKSLGNFKSSLGNLHVHRLGGYTKIL